MKSDWLDATLHISPEELRILDWLEAVTLGYDELPVWKELSDLTNPEECDIIEGEL